MKWHKLPQTALDSKQAIQLLQLEGKKICLIYHQQEWFATSAKCPHAGANLVGGWCIEGRLVCPYHRHSFGLRDGKGAAGQNNCISVYRIEKRADGMYVELPQNIFKKLLGF